MRFVKLPTFLFLLTLSVVTSAQNRYLEPVFDDVNVTTAIYGFNYTVLPLAVPGAHTLRQPLVARVYTPVGDVETERPLIIYLHTGNFFPYPQNGSCGGTLADSSNVEFATRLAKMGYVVAVADYRLGWNPFSTQELIRRFTLINGAYRGVQDVRACIRYFRKNVAEQGNSFGVDPDKIVVWGQGTGGYLSLATAYLDEFNEIYTTSDPNKFRLPLPNGTLYPMVQEQYNGDIFGVQAQLGIVDATYNAITGIPLGDTLFIPNHPGYDSDFELAVNMGGALGDSTWMDPGDIPLISFHVPTDAFAPCETDILNVPTLMGPQPVVEVSGSCDMQQYAEDFGLNDIFNTIPTGFDPFGEASSSSLSGFFPFNGTPGDTGSPWEWTTIPPSPADCNTDGAVARIYIDTIIGFFAPRACVTLDLGCNFTSTKEVDQAKVQLSVAPNPSSGDMLIKCNAETPMLDIQVFSMNGAQMQSANNIRNNQYVLKRNNLPPGMYLVKVRFEEGVRTQKVIFN